MTRLLVVLSFVLSFVLSIVLSFLLAGCPSAPSKRIVPPGEPRAANEDDSTRLARLITELQDDILSSYDHDEPPDLDTGMIDPRIGTARIGVGPEDVYIPGVLPRGTSRWPLDVDLSLSTQTYVRSKHLQIQIAADQSAAWMADEVSWRIAMCGRTAVIPLRITALYAHDGDRWVVVFEHLSFGYPPTPFDTPVPKPIKTEVVSGDLRDELSGVLGRGLFRVPHDPLIVAQDRSALVLGPDAGDEWHAAQVVSARLPAGRLEDRRVGLVGRDPAAATVAYWVGSYVADIPARPGVGAGKVRMRVTHVFEKRHLSARDRQASEAESCAPAKEKDTDKDKDKDKNADCRWVLVQSHMSQPITDDELTKLVFGTSLISSKPLALDCSDGPAPSSPMAPAAAPRRGANPPAARTP
jgi:hypothetical protein